MAENTIQDPVDPGFKKKYTIDYAAEIGPAKITGSTWELPAELAASAEAFTDTTATVTIDFAAAVRGGNYAVYNSVALDSGEARRRALVIPVRDAATFVDTSELKATLEAIRAAIAVSRRVMDAARRAARDGRTDRDVVAAAMGAMAEQGVTTAAFEPVVTRLQPSQSPWDYALWKGRHKRPFVGRLRKALQARA